MPTVVSASRRPLLPRLLLLGEVVYGQVQRDRLFMQAAALTYKTLFSLLPILVLSLLILSSISVGAGQNTLASSVKGMFFEQLNMDKLHVRDEAGNEVTLEAYADALIGNAQNSVSKNAAGASLVAFIVLLYGAISLMVVIEGTFNQIYGSVKARPWLRRIMLYWCVLTLGPIGVAASVSLGHTALSEASAHVGKGWLLSGANIFTGFAVSWLLILLMYRVIPDTRVQWRSAALGSFVAALVWEIGKWGFGLYVATVGKTSWYGSLALLPLFMLWIYITWSVVLIGLEISYVQQFWRLLKRRYLFMTGGKHRGFFAALTSNRPENGLSDMRWVLALGVLLCRRFREGHATHPDLAAEALILPNDVIGEFFLALEQAGLLHATSRGAYALARPPESITAFEMLEAVRATCQVPPDLAKETTRAHLETPALKELEKLEAEWAKGKTLAALVG